MVAHSWQWKKALDILLAAGFNLNMATYDEDSRYQQLDDHTYFDSLTDETVFVLTPEEQNRARDKVIELATEQEETFLAIERELADSGMNRWDSDSLFELASRSLLGRRVAANLTTRPSFLTALAESPDYIVRRGVAKNRNTPIDVLEHLSRDEDQTVRAHVSENLISQGELPQSPDTVENDVTGSGGVHGQAEFPETLAQDADEESREAIARNPNTYWSVLESLALDEDEFVRQEVASNPNAPVHVLQTLAGDEDVDVRMCVALNPSTPVKVLEALSRDEEELVRQEVARNRNSPVNVLEALAHDDDEVRENLADNPAIAPEILDILARDKNPSVQISVALNPRTPLRALISLLSG